MMKLSRQTLRFLLIVLWIASGCQHLFAQPETPFRPKVGLVFSGGGAKGFAHIGVLKVLEEIGMPIDCISGNSMGSIVGGLYAIGYRAADLEKIATQTDWDVVLKDRVERSALSMEQKFYDARYNVSLDLDGLRVKLPSGLISGQNVVRLLNRLTQPVQHIRDFTQFPIPFVCVATNIVTGEAVVLKSGSLAESIRASMSIPSAFTPIEIDGKLLVDGMIARNFPVQEAREVLGAEVIIGVDVGEELADVDGLDSFLSIMNQAVSFQMVKSTVEQRKLCNYLITPEVSEHGAGSFGSAEYFIAQGEKAAREMLPQLQALLQSIKHLPVEPENGEKIIYHAASPEDLILIAEVEIEGLQRLPRNFVMERLQIIAPAHISLAEVENGVDRVFGSQFFERVSYELAPNANGKRLILHVKERAGNLFRVGFRYDSKTEAALLLNTTFRNQGRPGSFLAIDAKLSTDLLFEGQYFTRTGFRRRIGFRWHLVHAQQSVDQFSGQSRIARQRIYSTFGETFLGTIFSNKLTIGGGLRLEYTRTVPTIAPIEFEAKNDGLLVFFSTLTVDTYDKTNYPTSGTYLKLSAEKASRKIVSERDFARVFLDARFANSLAPKLTLLSGIFIGNAIDDVPFHYQFMLGGQNMPFTFLGERNSFLGFRPQEFQNNNVEFLQMGFQYEIFPKQYLIVRGNVGNTFDKFSIKLSPNSFFYGGGATLGWDSRFGPIEFTASASERHSLITHLNVGFYF